MKTIKAFAVAGIFSLFFFLSSVALHAETTNLIYINGIMNTLEEAEKTADEIRSVLGGSLNYIGDQRKSFEIHTVWNPKGFYYEEGWDDFTAWNRDNQELFILKTAEEHYFIDFLIMSPLDKSWPLDQQAAQRVKVYLEDMLPGDNYLELSRAVTDAKMADTQSAVYALATQIINLQPVVVVAHSEGNLLANLAYAYLVSVYGDETKNMVKIINVANTSAFSVDNLNFTHEGDAALKALELLPIVSGWLRTTPFCNHGLCPFVRADPTLGKPDVDVEFDFDHSMEGTYLSPWGVPVLEPNDLGIEFTLGTDSFQSRFVDFVYAAANSFVEKPAPSPCGAYVAPGVWKEFDCYNLAAIGKTTNDDPFTPSWRLIGGYWQWGRKGPDSSQWHTTNTKNFAHGPAGPGVGEANDGVISGWDQTHAPDGSWSDASKTANDPCPAGYRVPTQSQWDGVRNNNPQRVTGTWSSSATNYSSARSFGDDLMLPSAGYRSYDDGSLNARGYYGYYWSSTQLSSYSHYAWLLYFVGSSAGTSGSYRSYGFSVRCVAE